MSESPCYPGSGSEDDSPYCSDSEVGSLPGGSESSPDILQRTPPRSRLSSTHFRKSLFTDSGVNGSRSSRQLLGLETDKQTPKTSRLTTTQDKSQSEPSRPRSGYASGSSFQSVKIDQVLQEVKETNCRLADLTNKLDEVESRLKTLEDMPVSSSANSEASNPKKSKVPAEVRVSDLFW